MKVAIPLTAKILIVALINVLVLAAVGAVFVRYELGQDLASFLLAAGRERSVSVARQLALDLTETETADRDALLTRYEQQHGVSFVLLGNDGTELAGRLAVPDQVRAQVTGMPGREGPPPRGGGPRRGGPPPFGDDRPGPPDSMRPAPPDPTRSALEPGHPPPFDGDRPGPADGRRATGSTADDRLPPMPTTPPFLVTAEGPMKYWVGIRIPIRARDSKATVPGTLLLASSSLLGNAFYFQPQPWVAIVVVTLGVTLLCWLPLVRSVTHAVSGMTRATADIAEGRFAVDALPDRRDELGALSTAIRTMAGRLETLVEGQRRFLADAAHELRSPLARMSLSLGLIERDADERSRRHVNDLREDVEQMAKLTDDLLAFARATLSKKEPAGQALRQPARLGDIANRAAHVEARDADVRVDVAADLEVTADPDLLFRAIANVIRNAVAYAGSAGPIRVTAAPEGDVVRVRIADEGPGIPEADLEQVFSAFYRPELSRDRRSGGTGLGLAIARSAITACGGSVVCRNLSPRGLEVSITLPLASSFQ